MALASKTFRIFVSSTFSDLKEERNALQKNVFPELRKLCMQYGFRFQAIDLRWGVSEKASLSHETMRICLKEIERCQCVTPRPNFLVLLGNRYGWEPIPEEVPSDEFTGIKKVIKDNKQDFPNNASDLIDRWYKEDKNAVPSLYILQPIDPDEYPEGKWDEQVQRPLLNILRKAVEKLDLSDEEKLKYVASATHQEVVNGAMKVEDSDEHVFGFFRSIENLDDIKKDIVKQKARDFMNTDSQGQFDESAHYKLKKTKKDLEKKLGEDNIFSYDVKWRNQSITTDHLDKLCEDVLSSLSKVIKDEAEKVKEIDDLEKEIDDHDAFGIDRARFFIGRVKILNDIEKYVKTPHNHPLVIYGESGSGKSALMAKAAEQVLSESPAAGYVTRFIGATPTSSDIRSLLENICRQISRIYGADETNIPTDYKDLVEEFPKRLALATPEKQLIIFLDALDQLSNVNNPANLNWFPFELPENVKLVVSTISILPDGSQEESYKILSTKLPEGTLLELKPMPPEEGEELLNLWFKNINRTLQKDQKEEILRNFKVGDNGKPLYLKLAFEEGRRWKSYTKEEETKLSPDISGIIQDLFKRLSLEKNHGETMVAKSLGYIAAGKNGISEDELIDVLSLDTEVIQDFMRRSPKSPKVDHLPVIVWSRLYFDLEPYIIERSADGTSLMTFYHPTTFGNEVTDKYLSGETKIQHHKQLAEYFKKQALYIDKKDQKTPNLRKLSELPYQQTMAELWEDITEILCDLEFIEAKCTVDMGFYLLYDYQHALNSLPEMQLELSKHLESLEKVREYSNDLVNYTKGSIEKLEIIDSIKPWTEKKIKRKIKKITASPSRSEHIRSFYHFISSNIYNLNRFAHQPGFVHQEAYNHVASGPVAEAVEKKVQDEKYTFMFLKTYYQRPDWNPFPACIKTLEGHSGQINSVSLTPDGCRAISGSEDNTLRVWDVESGRCLKILEGHSDVVCSVSLTPDGHRAVSGSKDKTLRLWDVESGRCLKTLEEHTGKVYSVSLTPDGCRAISGSEDNTLRVWDVESGRCLKVLEGHSDVVCSVSLTPDGRQAISGSKDKTLRLWDVESGRCLKTILKHTDTIYSVSLTADGLNALSAGEDNNFILWWDIDKEKFLIFDGYSGSICATSITADGRLAVSGSDDNFICIWDTTHGICLRTFEGHTERVCSLSITPDGRRLISGSEDNTLRVWDIERGICMKPIERHISWCLTLCLSPDGKQAVSGSGDKALRVWDTESGKCIRVLKGHTESVFIVKVTPNGYSAVSGSEDNTLRLWDVQSGKLMQLLNDAFPKWDWMDGDQETTLKGHTDSVWALSITMDGNRIISGSEDNTLRVWNRLKCLMTLKGHTGSINTLNLTPDSCRVVSGSEDNTLRVWDFEYGQCLNVLEGHTGSINTLSLAPDGHLAVSGSDDNTLRVWDLESGKCLNTLVGHTSMVNSLSLTPDGRRVVSGSDDNTLRVWDLKTSKCLKILEGPLDSVYAVSLSPDGRQSLSISNDNTLRIWDLETERCLAIISEPNKFLSISQLSGKSVIGVGFENGSVVLYHIRNHFLKSVPITAQRLWIFHTRSKSGKWSENISVCCSLCGKRFPVSDKILDLITSINRNAGITPEQSPILHLPDEAWDEPRLISECPLCHKPLKYNPFIVDNRDKSDISQGDITKKKDRKSGHFEQKFIVSNKAGLDARTAAKICNILNKIEADCYLEHKDDKINLKEALGLLTLGITRSDIITIICKGKMDKDIKTLFAPLINEGLLTPVDD